MVTKSVFILCALVFGNALYQVESVLRTTFIEDLCYSTRNSALDLRYDTSGILMSAPKLDPTEGFECEVVLTPPKGASVVLSIYRYDLYAEDVLIIEDSDRHRVALMGYGVFKDEKKSVISEGKLRVYYKTGNKTSVHMRAGFQFTFTKVMKSPCSSNEFKCGNGHCVLKEYICDGHNHCGDNSEQKKCGFVDGTPATDVENADPQKSRAILFLSLTITGAVVLLIVIIVFIVYVVKGAKLKKEIAKNKNPANPIPLRSVSTNVPHQAPSTSAPRQHPHVPQAPSTNVPRQASHAPSAHVPSPSNVPVQGNTFYNRVRRSFSGTRAQVENIPKEQSGTEAYQVPSMYPSLDVEPNAPEMYGVENPDFRIEE